jgi:hypothetical protein
MCPNCGHITALCPQGVLLIRCDVPQLHITALCPQGVLLIRYEARVVANNVMCGRIGGEIETANRMPIYK